VSGAVLARAKQLQRALFDAGLAWPQGPVELGRRRALKEWSLALDRVLGEYDLPSARGNWWSGLHIIAPANREPWPGGHPAALPCPPLFPR